MLKKSCSHIKSHYQEISSTAYFKGLAATRNVQSQACSNILGIRRFGRSFSSCNISRGARQIRIDSRSCFTQFSPTLNPILPRVLLVRSYPEGGGRGGGGTAKSYEPIYCG